MDSFLQERLPALGLDYETYGPYVRGLVSDDDDDTTNNNAHTEDNKDNDNNDDWDDILELLQASSETHCDDQDAFLVVLKRQLQERRAQHRADVQRRAQAQRLERQAEEHAILARDIQMAKIRTEEEILAGTKQKSSAIMDDAKRLLVARFEYDESELYGEDGTLIKTSAETDSENVVSNKDAAAMAYQEKMNQMKSQKTTSKKEEQQKTKQAKLDKVKQKEERRNKAQKGERHR